MTYHIRFPSNPEEGLPGLDEELARVTVFLGANGSGKSKLIQRLRRESSSFGGERPVVYVEGGRVVEPPPSVGLTRQNIEQFRDISQATTRYSNRRSQHKLADRAADLFVLLARKGEVAKAAHSDAVEEWRREGRPSGPPRRSEPPLERLFTRFSEIFPEIRLEVDSDSRAIRCHKYGSSFPPDSLSDGERQVLAILADVAILGDPNSLVLVDEPELNLNTQLACRLWDSIEAELPDAVFVYATHSLGFAMRGNVQKVFVLSGAEDNLVEIPDLSGLPSEELRQFLGAIPAILAAPGALVVEGEESSIDSIFYEWILGKGELVVVPVGSCDHVLAAAQRTGVWERLARDARVFGVVDSDYRSEESLARYRVDGCTTLDLHECESYLCHPNLIPALADSLGLVEEVPTPEQVSAQVVEYCTETRIAIVAKRTFARLGVRLGISLPRHAIETLEETEDLVNRALEAADEQRRVAERELSEEAVRATVDEERERIDRAIHEEDIPALLRLAAGKPLLARIMHWTGCRNFPQLARGASRHLSVDDFEHLAKLRDELMAGLGMES